MTNFLRRNVLDFLLWALFLGCLFLMFKTSTDSKPEFIKNTDLEYLFNQFPTGNQIIFDITVGIIVSIFVYLLVVRLPAWQKKRRIKAHLLRCYETLKEQCLMHFLWACKQPAESAVIDNLKSLYAFKAYFNERVSADQDRWHLVLNGLTEEYVQSLVRELDIFRVELEYALTAVEVDDDIVFDFLRNLTQVLQRSHHWSDREDQLKPLSQFMWAMFTGWSFEHGYTGRDFVKEMVNSI